MTFRDIEVYRIGPGGGFDLAAWQRSGGIAYRLEVRDGRLQFSHGDVY